MKYDELKNEAEKLWEGTNVVFYPYVGSLYKDAKVKILVLGESHYSKDPDKIEERNKNNTLTIETIIDDYGKVYGTTNNESFWEFPKGARFKVYSYINNYRKTANLITGVDNHNCDYTWEQFAFYNYFQENMGDTAINQSSFKKDPQGFINRARLALYDVLDKLSPDIVIIWGMGDLTKKRLPKDGRVSNVIPETSCFKYEKYPNTIFFPTYHPRTNNMPLSVPEWAILKENFPEIDEIAKRHHPAYEMILSIKEKTTPKLMGFKQIYSECSLQSILYPCINGKCVSNPEENLITELKFNEDLSSSICSKKGLELENVEELKFVAGTSEEILVNNYLEQAQKMLECRNQSGKP